jgi:hypothetical protein
MTLAALIRKGGLDGYATATQATSATLRGEWGKSVATVATVAVAGPIKWDAESHAERAAIIQANGIPKEWADGFALLCTMERPAAYGPERWRQLVDDGGYFLDAWGRQAAGLGWRAENVFGVNPDAPERRYDGMGLVPLLNGRRVVAITADTARIDCDGGAILTFYRQTLSPESVALWQILRTA